MKTRKGKQEKGNKTTGAYLDGHAAQQKPTNLPTSSPTHLTVHLSIHEEEVVVFVSFVPWHAH
jgi:hypothetical protein